MTAETALITGASAGIGGRWHGCLPPTRAIWYWSPAAANDWRNWLPNCGSSTASRSTSWQRISAEPRPRR